MSNPGHNKERFFKYTAPETALKILEKSAVRYSSPSLFNDPFDVQSGLHIDFDIQSLPDRIIRRVKELVISNAKPEFPNEQAPLARIVTRMWEMKATHGFPKERAWEKLRRGLEWFKDPMNLFQTQYQEHTWKNFLPRLRVFSVSEDRDNLLMWAHYAKDHTGAVFEFLVLPQDDNHLCAAQPVIYKGTPPSLLTEEQLLESIFEGKHRNVNPDILYGQYVRVKSDVWAYEKEWRVWYTLPEAGQQLYLDFPFHPKEIGAVYLGCKMEEDVRRRIIALVAKMYNQTKIHQARRSTNEFRLDYELVSQGGEADTASGVAISQ